MRDITDSTDIHKTPDRIGVDPEDPRGYNTLYGCLPDSKQNLRYFVKKSVASLYSALFVDWSGYPDFALAPMHIRCPPFESSIQFAFLSG